LSLWNRTALDQTTTSRIRDTLKRVLNLPPSTIMEYKTHTDSLRSVMRFVWQVSSIASGNVLVSVNNVTPSPVNSRMVCREIHYTP